QPICNRENSMGSHALQVTRVDRLLIVKAGKKQLEEVLADRGERALRRQVRAVDVVHSAADPIRSEDLLGDVVQVLVHRAATNIQHSTSNIQHPITTESASRGGCRFDVRYRMFFQRL